MGFQRERYGGKAWVCKKSNYFARKRNASFLRLVPTRLEWRPLGKACVNGSSELVSNIAMSLVATLYNYQLLAYIGEDGVAAYSVIGYTAMIFSAIFMGYALGSSPLMSYQYGARDHREMRSILMWSHTQECPCQSHF